jgi:protein TonB
MKSSVLYRTGLLACVAAAHFGVLCLVLSRLTQPAVTPPVPLQVVVAKILPATQPAVEVARPQPEAKPQPATQPKVQAKSKPARKAPVPQAPSVPRTVQSEKALRAPQPAASSAAQTPPVPSEPAPSGPPTPAAPPAPPAPPAPLTPPRFNAAYLNNPPPAYPPILRRTGEEGRVVLRVLVTAEGAASEVRVLNPSSSPLFDEAAVAAVRKWRFVPARRGDTPVAEWVQVPIEFKLN